MKNQFIIANEFYTVAVNPLTGKEIGLFITGRKSENEGPMVFTSQDMAQRKADSFNNCPEILANVGLLNVLPV